MNTLEKLREMLYEIFEGDVDTANVTLNTKMADLGINSIGYLYVAMAIEQEFGSKFTNDDFAKVVTVKDVIDLIENK